MEIALIKKMMYLEFGDHWKIDTKLKIIVLKYFYVVWYGRMPYYY